MHRHHTHKTRWMTESSPETRKSEFFLIVLIVLIAMVGCSGCIKVVQNTIGGK